MSIYMQMDNISGSVTAQNYKNWIALKSIDFGVLYVKKQTEFFNNVEQVFIYLRGW